MNGAQIGAQKIFKNVPISNWELGESRGTVLQLTFCFLKINFDILVRDFVVTDSDSNS